MALWELLQSLRCRQESYHTLTVAALTGRKIEVVVGSMASCSKRYTLYLVRTVNIQSSADHMNLVR
jgi:hypothetical protein